MTTELLSRALVARPVELRAAPEGSDSPGTLRGYGAVFNSLSRDLGGWYEEIDPLAFGAPLEDGTVNMDVHTRVICRTNHNSDLLLGTTSAGTLRLYLDEVGLLYECDLPDTSNGRDIAALAKRRDIEHSSFAFRTTPGGRDWKYDAEDRLVSRVLPNGAVLADVAPVADPAYWAATSELARSNGPDLDAVRASLKPQPGPPGEWENAASARATAISNTITGRK